MTEPHKHEKLDALIDRCHGLAPLRTAVVQARGVMLMPESSRNGNH